LINYRRIDSTISAFDSIYTFNVNAWALSSILAINEYSRQYNRSIMESMDIRGCNTD